MTIEVIDVLNNETFEVQEKERDGRAKHILSASTLNVTCILNTLTAEGYLVEGELMCLCGGLLFIPFTFSI